MVCYENCMSSLFVLSAVSLRTWLETREKIEKFQNFNEMFKDVQTSRKDLPGDSPLTRRPPTCTREKRTAQQKTRSENYAKKYLRDLKRAFDDADLEQLGTLSLEQWSNSSIRFYIREGKLSNEEFDKYFLAIDANCDGRVSWEELVDYLLLEITCTGTNRKTESLTSLNKIPISAHVKQYHHRDAITQIVYSNWTDEYITVSPDSIKFWQPNPLQYKRSMKIQGPFSCICVFKLFHNIVIATTTRILHFYDLQDLVKLPVQLAASPTGKSIKSMKLEDAESTYGFLKDPEMPLFNIPTQIIEASLTPAGKAECKFIVGDDYGIIDLFKLNMPQRRTGTDYSVHRLTHFQLHHKEITQMSVITDLGYYASASFDGTVKFFTIIENTVNVTKVFEDGSPIQSFSYCQEQRNMAICAAGSDPFVWTVHPVRRAFRLQASYASGNLVTEYISSLGERFVLTVTSKKNIRLFDSNNFVLRTSFEDSEYYSPENKFTAILFDSNRRVFITCATVPVMWTEGEVEGPRGLTHTFPIVGIHYQPDFDRLLTVDSNCNFFMWDYTTGERKSLRCPIVSEICSASIDKSGRRVITATFNGNVTLWNPSSGGHICDITMIDKTQISLIDFFFLNGRTLLVIAHWSKNLTIYREIMASMFEVTKSYQGHRGDISCAALDPAGWIITGSVNGEIISWPVDSSAKPKYTIFEDESPIESMAVVGYHLLVADSDGYLTILTLASLETILRMRAHTEIVPYSLCIISSHSDSGRVITGDTLGYCRLWMMDNNTGVIESLKLVRCHNSEITQIIFIGKNGKLFATAGQDYAVRLWATDSMNCIGTFGVGELWNTKEMTTWLPENPVEDEPRYFHNTIDGMDKSLKSVKSFMSIKSLKSTRSTLSLQSAVALMSGKDLNMFDSDRTEQSESTLTSHANESEFDFTEAHDLLEKVLNAPPILDPSSVLDTLDTDTNPWLLETPSIKIKSEVQAKDMVAKIKVLQAKTPINYGDAVDGRKNKRHKKIKAAPTFLE